MKPRAVDSESPSPQQSRTSDIVRGLKRHLSRLERKLEAVRGDLVEAEQAPRHRRSAEALLTYLKKVPARASRVDLPDPANHEKRIEIELDPAVSPQGNAARYFKLAAKGERGLGEIPARVSAVEAEIKNVSALLARITDLASEAVDDAVPSPKLDRLLDEGYRALPPVLQRQIEPASAPAKQTSTTIASGSERAPSSRLQPRRLRTTDGWDVLIGRSNEGNDYLTHHLARPEDYWFHVGGGVAGSHVVLRRGKGKNEPSKQTIEEVASWAAFYSQARTAGKVPVIHTLKKYVRKPRKAKPGLALCEREKSVMVRPAEPPKSALADEQVDPE